MLDAPELKAIPAPATRDTLLEVPFKLKFVAVGTFAEIVTFGLVESWDKVMFGPATNPKAVEDAVFTVPELAPPATVEMLCRMDWFEAEIVIVLAAWPMPILAPAESDKTPFEPFKEVTTFVAAGAGTEIVTLPLPTPTEAIPAPEKFSNPENVPTELLVVFPRAVRD